MKILGLILISIFCLLVQISMVNAENQYCNIEIGWDSYGELKACCGYDYQSELMAQAKGIKALNDVGVFNNVQRVASVNNGGCAIISWSNSGYAYASGVDANDAIWKAKRYARDVLKIPPGTSIGVNWVMSRSVRKITDPPTGFYRDTIPY